MGLGDRIRRRREELGLTQRELARRVRVRAATISDLERGMQKDTSTEVARRLAYELRVTLDWLIGPYVEDETDSESEPAALDAVGA